MRNSERQKVRDKQRMRNKEEEEWKIEEKESDKDVLEKQSLRILLKHANASQKRRFPFYFLRNV